MPISSENLRDELLRLLRNLAQRVERRDRALAEAIAKVNDKTQRFTTSVGPLAIGNTDVTVTWLTPWPDASYGVYVQITSGNAALGNLHWTVKAGSKETGQCVITINALAAIATVGVDVLGVRT